MTEFLVHMVLATPPSMSAAEVDDLRRQEAVRAAKLAKAGTLVRVWRIPGVWANWGLWRAPNRAALDEALASLPLHPHMTIEVQELEPHPNDPGRLRPVEGTIP